MAETQAPLKTYRGNCHCKAYVYEITLPEIKQAVECNCSICYKKAAIWVFPSPSNVKFVKGDRSTLSSYTFNQRKYAYSFCPTCGVSLMVTGHLKEPQPGEVKEPDSGFNVRTLQYGQLDIRGINFKAVDGKAYPPLYEEPKFTGPQPAREVEGGQLYSGSCHCGAVTVGLKSKPFNKDFRGLKECNCSICGKYGAVWTYPHSAQVVIEGRENLRQYAFNEKIGTKLFCKTCGIPIGSDLAQFTDEKLAQMNPGFADWFRENRNQMPLNLRIFNGLDLKDLVPQQIDGYNQIQPAYVEP
ncbi:glutathione-dependent formaldehyde-activating enzyme [Xylaria intraflava]|nr:glutathione-dependent formaldehyde-activating enzyme [Xylaria intraflava]